MPHSELAPQGVPSRPLETCSAPESLVQVTMIFKCEDLFTMSDIARDRIRKTADLAKFSQGAGNKLSQGRHAVSEDLEFLPRAFRAFKVG